MIRVEGPNRFSREDRVAVEEPLEIRIDGRALGVTMRTPGEDEDLAAGLLLSEGVIHSRDEIGSIAVCRNPDNRDERNVVDVFLAHGVAVDWDRLRRSMLTNSSCGLCGKATIEALMTRADPLPVSGALVAGSTLTGLDAALRERQTVFAATGGLHAAGLFTADGRLVVSREDIGRHNATDKAIGSALRAGLLPIEGGILLVSGRASYEIVQKAAVARLPVVAAVSAPSSLAVELADEFGITLAGFLREGAYNLYTHPERIGAG